MKVVGTKQACACMLEERGVYKKLGVERSTVSNWKRALSGADESKMPSLDKMEELLYKYGAEVVQEKVWALPFSKEPAHQKKSVGLL